MNTRDVCVLEFSSMMFASWTTCFVVLLGWAGSYDGPD